MTEHVIEMDTYVTERNLLTGQWECTIKGYSDSIVTTGETEQEALDKMIEGEFMNRYLMSKGITSRNIKVSIVNRIDKEG